MHTGICSPSTHTHMHTLAEVVALIRCSCDQSVAHLIDDLVA